ncbi:NYN domain, limkain-b1-type [Penicillium roqueforti FM164]|uniref:NYN domain, limkain-b1-type n=1 Tax=Penicillium roqueforti (strain FM164) TaxID=1365484 RepID=W6Q8E0_PENRF|nr:NYN domain, limkain-b1-type [Penicillium roqueforti FM164]
MVMACDKSPKLVVLIDADNAQFSIVTDLLAEFAYTHGKNATDLAMIVDAMDLLHSGNFDGFCLVSSDSDFTRLATRIRESGLKVYGFGERKTPKPFVAACDEFIYTEDLKYLPEFAPNSNKVEVPKARSLIQDARHNDTPDSQLKSSAETSLDNSGWARLSEVGEHLINRHPDFNPSTHGYSKLSDLIIASPHFDIEERPPKPGEAPDLLVRRRKASGGNSQV